MARLLSLAAGVAFLLACQAGSARAQTASDVATPYAGGDPAVGKAFARKTCASCHVVARDQRPSQRVVVGPDFPAIANLPSTTALSLAVFLRSPHSRMPNFLLSADELKDVIAYILSLRERG